MESAHEGCKEMQLQKTCGDDQERDSFALRESLPEFPQSLGKPVSADEDTFHLSSFSD